ncbi:MAG: helix-turn-helix domain-containing protein [Bacteroidota bacterium]
MRANMLAFRFKKGDILVKEGAFCEFLYFIKRGALSGTTSHQGKKIVTYISVENEFVSSISGLYGLEPSKEEISAVENVSLLAISNVVLQRLFLTDFDLNFLFRVMVEQYYKDAQERTHIVRVGSAKERYLYFTKTKPGYIERLPLDAIASLLDMTPLTLIKIIKQQKFLNRKDKGTEAICRNLENYIVDSQVFTDRNVSLSSLASAVDLSSHKLSSLLNNHYQQSFKDFINSYRIDRLKVQIANPANLQNFTIESLAYDAGFASRSAFYNSFKKIVGMTPVEYVKSL